MAVVVEAAQPEDLQAMLALVARNGLPQDGLRDHMRTALVAREGRSVVGSAALEVYGTAALLRSVAVDSSLRGNGVGQQLTRAALELARSQGITHVYLLTETAGDFFPRFGFRTIERSAVAPAVRRSLEFTCACPESAQAMVLSMQGA